MTTSEQYKEMENKYYMFLVRRQPMVLEKGEGARVWDVDGTSKNSTANVKSILQYPSIETR